MSKQPYFLGMSELILPQSAPYEETHAAINRFIDFMPSLVEELSKNMERGEYSNLKEVMVRVLPLVSDVNAKVLEADSKLIIRRIELTGYPSVLIRSFITNLLSLSVKMQNAQNHEGEIEHMKKVEAHADIIHAMSSFITLVICRDYTEAYNLIDGIKVFDHETLFVFDELLTLLVTKDYDKAKNVASDLKEKHIKAIKQSAGSHFGINVLAVDDMPESLSFVSSVLKNHFKVFRVTNGKTALKVLETQRIDLFILDIDMPEMNGFELAERIRGTSGYGDTPIIFLTGNSSREHITMAMQVGGNDFVIKPASYEMLLTAVSKYTGEVEH